MISEIRRGQITALDLCPRGAGPGQHPPGQDRGSASPVPGTLQSFPSLKLLNTAANSHSVLLNRVMEAEGFHSPSLRPSLFSP